MLSLSNPLTPATTSLEERLELFLRVLGPLALDGRVENKGVIVNARAIDIRKVLTALRDDERSGLDVLIHVGGVDYLPREPRFDVVYEMYSVQHRHRCRVKVQLADTGSETELPKIDSVSDLFLAAIWHERETADLMGLEFVGHPDPRRILLPDRWDGHPLRRDYPFDGKRAWNVGTTVVDGLSGDTHLGLKGNE